MAGAEIPENLGPVRTVALGRAGEQIRPLRRQALTHGQRIRQGAMQPDRREARLELEVLRGLFRWSGRKLVRVLLLLLFVGRLLVGRLIVLRRGSGLFLGLLGRLLGA